MDGKKEADGKAGIMVTRDGPYMVSGNVPMADQRIVCGEDGIPLKWEKGREYPRAETSALCRCGRSRDRPRCDGTHSKTGFVGTETAGDEAYLDHPDRTEGPGLILWDTEKLCAVALFCHRAGDAWNLTEQSGDPGKKDTAIQEAADCPSGRLVACDRPDGQALEPPFEPSLGFVFGPQKEVEGPIWVRGRIPVQSADGRTYKPRNRVTLCRCGKSCNKPFCDGEHRKASPELEVPG